MLTTDAFPFEFKVQALRECRMPTLLIESPEYAADYWLQHVRGDIRFNPDVETLALLTLNARKRLTGHTIVSNGSLDTILVSPREIFKPAVIASASTIILIHNHPSGDPSPSEADIKVTRDLIRCGQLMKIELADHLIMGIPTAQSKGWSSLRELGYFQAF